MDSLPLTPEAKRKEKYTRAALGIMIQRNIPMAIRTIQRLARYSKSEAIRMQASKILIDKGIPDIKAVEVTGQEGGPVQYTVLVGNGFNPNKAIEGETIPMPVKELVEAGLEPEKVLSSDVANPEKVLEKSAVVHTQPTEILSSTASLKAT